MTQDEMPLDRKTFVDAFTGREGTMEIGELHHRMDIILTSLKTQYDGAKESGKQRLAGTVANCLRGALIRASQYVGDEKFSKQVDELVRMTLDIL